jgi:hypothetical protein
MSEVMRWKLKGFIPGIDGVSKALFQPWVVPAEDFDRVTAERDALQLRLNAADQRIDEMIAQHQGEPAPEPNNEFDARFLRSIDSGNGQSGAFAHNFRPGAFSHDNHGACPSCGEYQRIYGSFQTDPFRPMFHDYKAASAQTPGRAYSDWVNKCEKLAQPAPEPEPRYTEYVTHPGESLMGIANRQLRSSERWVEIRDLNAHAFPDMLHYSYYPVGTTIKLPA